MNRIVTCFLLLWSSGLQTEAINDLSEPGDIRLVRGATNCAGSLEMKLHNDWKPVDDPVFGWNLRTAAVVCRQLDCGSAVSAKIKHSHSARYVWKINASSVETESALTEYVSVKPQYSSSSMEITCSESVRLVNGITLCSGRVELKANRAWYTVCEGDFDWQDAEVVCAELGCGAPVKLQKALYENLQALEWTKEFQCRGNESTLLDCDRYESARNTCSPIGLTCSEPDNVRLVGGGHRCAGRLELKLQGEWKLVEGSKLDQKSAYSVCGQLKCGSAVSSRLKNSEAKSVWGIISPRVQSGSALRERVSTRPWHSSFSREIACSDVLFQPMISISPSGDWLYTSSSFTISCSIKPQYSGGSFQLILTTSNTTRIYAQKAVNHTARFLFPAANHGHQGNYSCVYHIYVFSHNFSSESQPLSLTILASPTVFITRLGGLLLTLALFLSLPFIATKRCLLPYLFKPQGGRSQEDRRSLSLTEGLDGASRAEGVPNDVADAQQTNL